MKIGDIVYTPDAGFYGNKPAIVTKLERYGTTVHTGTAELVYDTKVMQTVATIRLMPRSYSTTTGNRLRVCQLLREGQPPREIHVLVGYRGEGHETRALEIRKLAFKQLLDDGVLKDKAHV